MNQKNHCNKEKKYKRLHLFVLIIFFLVCIQGNAQRRYDSWAIPNDTMKTVINENFSSNINGWPVGNSTNMAARLNSYSSNYSYMIDNYKQDQSIVYMVPKWNVNPQNNFIIKTEFNLDRHPPVGGTSAKDVSVWGGGFVWGATEPYKNMYILYFRMDKPIVEYGQWNDQGAYKVLKQFEIEKTSMNHKVELHRNGNNLSCYEKKNDTLRQIGIVPFQQFTGNQIGFYVSGASYLSARNLNIQETMSKDEREALFQQHVKDFKEWMEVVDRYEKEKLKFAGKKMDDLSKKSQEKLRSLNLNLADGYAQLGNIKRLDGDLQTAIVFYTRANELDILPVRYALILGKAYEENYEITQNEMDKTMALKFYFESAKKDRDDLGMPGGLKAYYKLRYPFIEDFTLISSNWQNENLVPKTKEEYDLLVAKNKVFLANQAKWRQRWAALNKRPKFEAIQLVLYDTHPQDNYIASTMKTARLTAIDASALQAGDFYYDPVKKDFVMAGYDGTPVGMLSTATVYMNRDYNFTFQMVKEFCKVCHGEGYTVSSGGYSYKVATGSYTESRSAGIVGQTDIVTRTPVYETKTIQGAPTYTLCKACNGTGGPPPQKYFNIVHR